MSALTSYDIQMPLDRTLLVQLDWEIESNEEKQGIFFFKRLKNENKFTVEYNS